MSFNGPFIAANISSMIEAARIVDNKNIITSCGSDSHGYECDDTKHGILGSQSMSEERLNKFLNKLNEI